MTSTGRDKAKRGAALGIIGGLTVLAIVLLIVQWGSTRTDSAFAGLGAFFSGVIFRILGWTKSPDDDRG